MAKRKSPLEKMMTHAAPSILQGPDEWNARYGGEKMLISSPKAIAEVLKTIPKGKVITMGELRDKLAIAYGADYSCPMTTGIFLRIVSEAYKEMLDGGGTETWPYWRVVRDNGELIDKFPGGTIAHAKLLEEEGHTIVPKGAKSHRLVMQ